MVIENNCFGQYELGKIYKLTTVKEMLMCVEFLNNKMTILNEYIVFIEHNHFWII